MITVVLEMRCLSTDNALTSLMLMLGEVEYEDLKRFVAALNDKLTTISVECYSIA